MTVTRVKTTAGWLDLNTTGPKGDKGDPGYYEYSYIASAGATKDLSTPAGTWGNLAIPTTVNINQPAGAFVVNANGSMTVRDAGIYDIEASVTAVAAWATANVRMITGLGLGATAIAAADVIARADSTVSVASEYPATTLAGSYYLAAGSIIWVTYFGVASAGTATCARFSIARIGAGPPGPTGPAGPTGVAGATGGQVYTQLIGDGVATSFTVGHNLHTRAVSVSAYRTNAPYDEVEADVERSGIDTVTIRTSPTVPAANEYTVVVAAAGTLLNPPAISTAPPTVSALPSSPVDGQEVYFVADATNGVMWHLRYRAASASAYKWEFVGGPMLFAAVEGAEELTSSGSFVDLATVGPQVTLPLAGDYMIEHGADVRMAAANGWGLVSIKFGAATASDNDRVDFNATTSGNWASVARTMRRNGLAATTVLKQQYRTAGTSVGFSFRWLSVLPVRVG